MKKTKKMLALALVASMVMGSSLVAIADETTNNGGVTGSGTVEGHVDRERLNVILPTVETGSSAFTYTMDPERLIQGTNAAKYAEGTVFPDAANDTGVYFLTETNTYANTSSAYQVVNKSSCDVTLTVKVKATQNTAGDIALVSESAITSATSPSLYLGLKVGNTTQEISTTEQTITKTIAGAPNNFNVAVKTTGEGENATKTYEYQEKADASTWKAMKISMTGKVSNKDITNDTTAPAVNVTWSWAKAGEGVAADTDAVDFLTDAAPSIATTEYTATSGSPVNVTVNLGAGGKAADGIAKVRNLSSNAEVPAARYSLDGNTLTFDATYITNNMSAISSANGLKLSIVFKDADSTAVTITLKKE